MASPLVSVVIPTYNRADLLQRAIRGALAQTYVHLEVIVADDASTDDTAAAVAGITDSRVTYIRHGANRGVSAARNMAIRAAKGELIAFLDDDDVWLPDKLEKQVPLFGLPQVGLICCGIEGVDREGRRQWVSRPYLRGHIYEALLFKNYFITSTVVVRRSCLEEDHLFDEALTAHEDYDLWLRIAENWAVDYVPEVLAQSAAFAHSRLNSPSRIVPIYEQLVVRFAAYHYASPVLRRRVMAYRYYTLAGVHGVNGQTGQACRAYLRSLAIWPFNLKAWASLAAVCLGPGPYRRFDRAKTQALRLANRLHAR